MNNETQQASQYVIFKNAPPPPPAMRGAGLKSPQRLTMEKMSVGDYTEVPKNAISSCHGIAKSLGFKIVARVLTGDKKGLAGIWRTA